MNISELLRELAQEGTGMLLTTHDMEEAEALCHRVGFLVDGRVRAEGTVASLVGEAFGGDRELIVTVAEAPDEPARAALAAEGLQETRIAQTWTARLPRDQTDVSAIERRLDGLGLGVSELRLREPGLRSVYLRLTGREYEG